MHKPVKLSIGTVEIVTVLTWGMQERIRGVMLDGFKMKGSGGEPEISAGVLSLSKYKALEVCVKKITLTDGTEIQWSKDWMDDLSIEDGDKLMEAVNAVTNPQKK